MSDYPIIPADPPSPIKLGTGEPDPPGGKPFFIATAGVALLGGLFAGMSTSDFINHLDRQVHSIHCSFIPGAAAELGESGCRTVMMSPYSSMFRESLWGGLPISLWALAVFAYLVFRAGSLALQNEPHPNETKFLVAATGLPVAMSLIYGMLALFKVGATCKLCVGVYLCSLACFVLALVGHNKTFDTGWNEDRPGPGRWFAEGVGFVALLTLLFVFASPSNEKSVKGCGTLVKKDDPAGIMVPLGKGKGAPAVAVLDPLCPACKAFDDRLGASGLLDKLNMNAVLFPLDASCNWMVKQSMHPGACAVTEAMLCDKAEAAKVLEYAFENQQELRDEAEKDDAKLRQRLEAKFPKLAGCLGSTAVKNKVNKSLRWVVANALPVLTPQLFIGDRRVCDEDTDLGLEFTITSMLNHAEKEPARSK